MDGAHVDWDDSEARRRITTGQKHALARGAGLVLAVANRTVPFREGTLTQSGNTDVDEEAGKASVYYDTPYAVRLHENPQFHFNNGRRGKWLSLALGETEDEAHRLMADVVKAELP